MTKDLSEDLHDLKGLVKNIFTGMERICDKLNQNKLENYPTVQKYFFDKSKSKVTPESIKSGIASMVLSIHRHDQNDNKIIELVKGCLVGMTYMPMDQLNTVFMSLENALNASKESLSEDRSRPMIFTP